MRTGIAGKESGFAGCGMVVRLAVAAAIVLLGGCRSDAPAVGAATIPPAATQPHAQTELRSTRSRPDSQSFSVRKDIGFRSPHYLHEHFAKHGAEFGGMSEADYLLAAQTLRDRPAGGEIEEIVRSDGTTSRFDRGSGAFLAFDGNGTIRTFFKPNDGERYFRRQASRSH